MWRSSLQGDCAQLSLAWHNLPLTNKGLQAHYVNILETYRELSEAAENQRMSNLYVCLPLEDSKIIQDVQLLTSQCSCDVEIAGSSLATTLVEQELAGCSGMLVILREPLADLVASESIIATANKYGLKIISIWPKHSKANVLPQSLEKYGAALLPWDAEKLSVISVESIWCGSTLT